MDQRLADWDSPVMTAPDWSTRPSGGREANGWDEGLRSLSLALVGAIFLAGLFGLLGARSTTVAASANGFSIDVAHDSITRPGLATTLDLSVATADGSSLPATVTTRIATVYLAMFDQNGLDPQPVSSFQSGEWTWWTFDVPEGAALLRVRLDARLEPRVQWGQVATAAVEIDDQEVVAVEFETLVMP